MLLKPTAEYNACGVTVKEYLLKGTKKLLCGTGHPANVTVHNSTRSKYLYAESYVFGTEKGQMGDAFVHLYVDEKEAWQEGRAGLGMSKNDPFGKAEVTYHAGDTKSDPISGGNASSISIEILMTNNDTEADRKAYDNGARLAAFCLWRHRLSINDLVTHVYWTNKKDGKTNKDRDIQSTTRIKAGHWCPLYIFRTTEEKEARKNWLAFKDRVNTYLECLKGDVNGDGKIDEADSVRLARYLAGWDVKIDEYEADINGDGKIDEKDSISLARRLAGWLKR